MKRKTTRPVIGAVLGSLNIVAAEFGPVRAGPFRFRKTHATRPGTAVPLFMGATTRRASRRSSVSGVGCPNRTPASLRGES